MLGRLEEKAELCGLEVRLLLDPAEPGGLLVTRPGPIGVTSPGRRKLDHGQPRNETDAIAREVSAPPQVDLGVLSEFRTWFPVPDSVRDRPPMDHGARRDGPTRAELESKRVRLEASVRVDDGLRAVRAPVSNDEDLEVPERLTERAFHRERQDRAPVVGGDDDGDERRRGGPAAIRETMGSRVARGCGHLASSARLVSDGARDDGTLQGVIEG